MIAIDSKILNGLNPSQHRAVTAEREPQLVLAGPGTGKTRVLVRRAAYLIDHPDRPIEPSRVCLFTYTNKAASQLRNRLSNLIGHRAGHVRAGTIHHFAYTLVRDYHEPLGLPHDFVIADELLDAWWVAGLIETSAALEAPAALVLDEADHLQMASPWARMVDALLRQSGQVLRGDRR